MHKRSERASLYRPFRRCPSRAWQTSYFVQQITKYTCWKHGPNQGSRKFKAAKIGNGGVSRAVQFKSALSVRREMLYFA